MKDLKLKISKINFESIIMGESLLTQNTHKNAQNLFPYGKCFGSNFMSKYGQEIDVHLANWLQAIGL